MASKGVGRAIPGPRLRPQYVLGSRPESLRAPVVPRVKPGDPATTQYGKANMGQGLANIGGTPSGAFGPPMGKNNGF